MTKTRMKFSAAVTGALLAGSALAGCAGGSGSGAYCDDIKKAEKDFGALDQGDFNKLEDAFKTFHTLADEAPSKIKSDWKTLDGAITAIEKAFKDAGVKFSDLAELQKGKIPEGVDESKLPQLSSTLSDVGGAKFKTASDHIAKHAKDECKVDING